MSQILQLRPIRVKGTLSGNFLTGIVRVTKEVNCGFLWRKSKVISFEVTSTTGILWKKQNGASQHRLSDLITAYRWLLIDGQTVNIGERDV